MSEGFPVLDIIIFALLAGFLILRLRSVLGRRTGHEKQRPFKPMTPAPGAAARDDNVVALPPRGPDARSPSAQSGGQADAGAGAEARDAEPSLADGLSQIKAADSGFRADDFLAGARVAFEMILESFARGDSAALRPLLADDVYRKFAAAIDTRERAGEVLETTLVGIRSAELVEARLQGRDAIITVKFVSEQVNVTKKRDGTVVDGDPSEVVVVTDVWTFQRSTRARDPNWTLVATHVPS
ncbi:MAG: Tim44 domain-containing protein [Alphaproteobacteria bacterium]|nr:Tim44 domain-containing protein [Alphaproteobacteria bacterium]